MQIDINYSKIPGCIEIISKVFRDARGTFVKTFHENVFRENGLATNFAEEYYSVSHKRVLRGLHFQLPPKDHIKLVYCVSGKVLDVVVDLRVGSPTYGKFELFEVSAEKANMIYIPKGLAHGFYVESDSAIVIYKVTSVYFPEYDTGILWNSVGIPWPEENPIVSERDRQFVSFSDFESPFFLEKGLYNE